MDRALQDCLLAQQGKARPASSSGFASKLLQLQLRLFTTQ